MDIQRFEIENITKSGFACVRDILTDRLLVTSDSCDILNEQYQRILDLQSQLDQQKAMWNELKEHISNQIIHYDELSDRFKEENNNGCVLLANSKRNMIEEILYKMQELEKGEKDVKD